MEGHPRVARTGAGSAARTQPGGPILTTPRPVVPVHDEPRSWPSNGRPEGCGVNAIAPGYLRTEFITMLSARGILDAERLVRRTPMGRICIPEEIDEVAVFLASPASTYTTGEILTVEGEWSPCGHL